MISINNQINNSSEQEQVISLINYSLENRKQFSFIDKPHLFHLYVKICNAIYFKDYSNTIKDLNTMLDPRDKVHEGVLDMSKIFYVSLNEYMNILDTHVFKRLTTTFSLNYFPIKRHIVLQAPEGYGKSYCTELFCKYRKINFIRINPYLVKKDLIYDTVRFACMTKAPTIIFFDNAHLWLCGSADQQSKNGIHQSRIVAAPFIPDFLHTMNHPSLIHENDLIWFVYSTTIDYNYFYMDFKKMDHIIVSNKSRSMSVSECQGLILHTLAKKFSCIHNDNIDFINEYIMRLAEYWHAKSPKDVYVECEKMIYKKLENLEFDVIQQLNYLNEKIVLYDKQKNSDIDEQSHRQIVQQFFILLKDHIILTNNDVDIEGRNNGYINHIDYN